MARMGAGPRSNARIEELDAPVAEVKPVTGSITRWAGRRAVATSDPDDGSADPASASVTGVPDPSPIIGSGHPIDPLDRASLVIVTAVVVSILVLALGDDGPWIVVVPALTAVGAAWLDRRIPFSFAEGLIGYPGDPEPMHGVPQEDRRAAVQRSAPASS